MILFIGQIARDMSEREAFQEIDYRRMFGPLAKWVAEIDRAERVPEFVARAFATATSGRPGPVVLALPEDMLRERVEARPCDRYQAGSGPPGRGRYDPLPGPAGRGRAALGGGWRRRLDACRLRPLPALRRGLGPAGRRLLPLPILSRQRASELRRPRRHRHRALSADGRHRGRPAAGGRRAHGRDHLRRLQPATTSPSRSSGWCTSTRGPRNWAGSIRPRCRSTPECPPSPRRRPRSARKRRPPGPAPKTICARPCAPASRPGARRSSIPARCSSPRSWPGSTAPCRPRPSSPTAPATIRSGCTASTATANTAASSGRPRAPWATACRPRSPPSGSIPSARWSPSPATAASR